MAVICSTDKFCCQHLHHAHFLCVPAFVFFLRDEAFVANLDDVLTELRKPDRAAGGF